MRYYVTIRDTTVEVDLEPDGLQVNGKVVDTDLVRVEGTDIHSLLVNGVSHRLVARREGQGSWRLFLRGQMLEADVVDERTRAIREMTGSTGDHRGPKPVRAPMPGLVVKVDVEQGQEVEPGQGVVIVEAMKMENELTSEAGGRVATVHVTEGQAVDKDEILIEFEAPDSGE
jgi:biotin carboxyl carrier protein